MPASLPYECKRACERYHVRHAGRIVEIEGLEPSTYGLQSRRSSQLSYIPSLVYEKGMR